MLCRSLAAVLALCTLPACGSPPNDNESSSGSSSSSSSGESSSGEAEASSSSSADGSSSTSSSTSAEDTSGTSTGEASASSSGTSGGETDSSSGDATTGDDESSSGSSTGGAPRWEHEGVAKNVAVADLVGWELCWSGTYGAGDLVAKVTSSCKGDHLMMACRPTGGDKLTVAAHAPREDVLFPVDYGAGERHEANGVNWYWSPTSNIEGFAPADEAEGCHTMGLQPDHLCWVNADDEPLTFAAGRRCGNSAITSQEAPDWERVVLHSWN